MNFCDKYPLPDIGCPWEGIFMRKRDLIIAVGALAAAVLLTVYLFSGGVLETGSWGLSFRQDNVPPVAPASPAQLARYGGVYLGDATQKVICLTFDAGYENGCTEQILDTLKAHQVPAAFFLVGSYIEKNADLVRRMVEEGHIVGNHTMHHPDMSQLTDKASFEKELTAVEEIFREKTGKDLPKYYRPPQGVYSEENLKLAQELGYRTVFWSLAYADWNNDAQPTKEQAFDKLLPRIHNGAVVLLHSTSKTNAAILDELLTRWKEMGYSFCSLEELCGT